MIAECEKNNVSNAINDSKKNRIGSKVEQKVIQDIIDIWQAVDTEKGGQLATEFVAANPNRLPSVNADQFNLQFLITSILKLQQ